MFFEDNLWWHTDSFGWGDRADTGTGTGKPSLTPTIYCVLTNT